MAHENDPLAPMPVRRLERFPQPLKLLSIGLGVIGLLAFVAALFIDAARAWRAYLFNWLFWISVAQGAVVVAAAITITRGIWARPVRRIALSFVAFLPVAFLLMIPLLFAGDLIFPWVGETLHGGKDLWLSVPFLGARNIIAVGALTGVSLLFAYWSLRPDAGLLREEATGAHRKWYDRLTRNWIGQEQEEVRATHRLRTLAPVLALIWAAAFTNVVYDFVMSLEPEWWSTLFGPYFFMPGFLTGLAATAILAIYYSKLLNLEDRIGFQQRHDLGKLIFAFVIFWAYLFWAQFLVIWYGLLPYEQLFVVERFEAPYSFFALAVLFSLFVIPFFGLLGVAPKKKPATLTFFSFVVLFGLWLERWLLVYPSYYPEAPDAPLGWMELGTTLGFAGIFIASVLWFATRFPILQVWEPLTEGEITGITTAPAREPTEAE